MKETVRKLKSEISRMDEETKERMDDLSGYLEYIQPVTVYDVYWPKEDRFLEQMEEMGFLSIIKKGEKNSCMIKLNPEFRLCIELMWKELRRKKKYFEEEFGKYDEEE